MSTQHQYKTKKEFVKSKPVSSDQLYQLSLAPEFLLQQKNIAAEKKVHKRSHRIKRTSPFLLTALLLPVVFIFLLMTNGTNDKWLLSFLFTCLEINILFTDFALGIIMKEKDIAKMVNRNVPDLN